MNMAEKLRILLPGGYTVTAMGRDTAVVEAEKREDLIEILGTVRRNLSGVMIQSMNSGVPGLLVTIIKEGA